MCDVCQRLREITIMEDDRRRAASFFCPRMKSRLEGESGRVSEGHSTKDPSRDDL